MPLRVNVDVGDLVKWTQSAARTKRGIKRAAARALNTVGHQTVERMAQRVSRETGLPTDVTRRMLSIKEATEGSLSFEINASKAMIGDEGGAAFPQRGFTKRPNEFFRSAELVDIVTMGDEAVCPLCSAFAAEGPHTIEKVRLMQAQSGGSSMAGATNIVHPNCRCLVKPHRSRRGLPVEMRRGGEEIVDRRLTLNQLLKEMAKETDVVLRARA